MFKIENKVIHCTRGDEGIIPIKLKSATFGTGDIITFGVYEKNGLNKSPLIYKEVSISGPTSEVNINLSSEDTKIGEMLNKEITYWYEIELNHKKTLLGYDENKAKEFILYPEGATKTVTPEEE